MDKREVKELHSENYVKNTMFSASERLKKFWDKLYCFIGIIGVAKVVHNIYTKIETMIKVFKALYNSIDTNVIIVAM